MKKIFTVLLIALMCFSALSAEETSAVDFKKEFKDEYAASSAAYLNAGSRFAPTNARMAGMGGAGLSLVEAEYGLFVNPASLAEGKLRISLPSVSVTLYHAYDALKKDSNGKNLFDKIGGDKDTLVAAVLNVVGTELAPLASADVSASLVLPFGLGIGLYGRDTIYTYSGTAVDQLDVSLALGYAYGLNLGDFRVSAGVTAKMNVLAFNQRLKVATVIKSEDIKEMSMNVAVGYSVPVIDFGVTGEWKKGPNDISASLVVSNLFSKYRMGIVNTSINGVGETVKSDIKYDDFTIKTKPSVDFGLGYEFESSFVDFAVAADLTDLVGMFSSLKGGEAGRVILRHLNTGVEVSLIDTFAFRAGMSSGYFTVGTAIDLFALRIEAAYYWNEMGTAAGERGLDGLTIRFNLGYER